MHSFTAALVLGVSLNSFCQLLPHQPVCLPRGDQLLAVLSPSTLTDFLAASGPLLSWLPLLCMCVYTPNAYPSTRRTILALALAWLCLIWPVRLCKRGLLAALGAHFDPSGHVLLYGMHLLPAWAHLAEAGSAAALRPVPLLLRRAWVPLLLYLSAFTAAFFHAPGEVAAAWALVLGVHTLLARHPALLPSPAALLGAACAWAALGCTLLGLLTLSPSVGLPKKLHLYALHDAGVLALGLWASGSSSSSSAPAAAG
jgi:hypothetical protein